MKVPEIEDLDQIELQDFEPLTYEQSIVVLEFLQYLENLATEVRNLVSGNASTIAQLCEVLAQQSTFIPSATYPQN